MNFTLQGVLGPGTLTDRQLPRAKKLIFCCHMSGIPEDFTAGIEEVISVLGEVSGILLQGGRISLRTMTGGTPSQAGKPRRSYAAGRAVAEPPQRPASQCAARGPSPAEEETGEPPQGSVASSADMRTHHRRNTPPGRSTSSATGRSAPGPLGRRRSSSPVPSSCRETRSAGRPQRRQYACACRTSVPVQVAVRP
jgi:hypothetical protein